MKRNKLPIFGCCLIIALLGIISGGIFVVIAALVLPKVMSALIHKMRMQDCDCDCGCDPDCECDCEDCSEARQKMAEDSQAAPQQG